MKKYYTIIALTSLMLATEGCGENAVVQVDDCNCLDTQTCIENVCVDNSELCAGIKCLENETCIQDVCVDNTSLCGENICTPEQTCVEGTCVDNNLKCGENVCTPEQTCVEGTCIDNNLKCGENICTPEQTCVENTCVDNNLKCGENICTPEQTCVENTCVDNNLKCGENICTPEQTCVEGTCIDNNLKCGENVCTPEQTCVEGTCVDNNLKCGENVCTPEQTCVENTCVETSLICGTEICSVEQTCYQDKCVENSDFCGEVLCSPEETCWQNTCVASNLICGTEICTDSQTCIENACILNNLICGAEICTEAQTCINGHCVNPDQLCGGAVCSSNQKCYQDECIATDLFCGDIICSEQQICVEGVCQEPIAAQLIVAVEGTPIVNENGTSLNVQIKLTTQPTANVTVSVTSYNDKELSIAPTSLTFTPEDWQTPKSIVVTGMDDDQVDGSITSSMILTAVSEDTDYNGLEEKIDITNEDNDIASLEVESIGSSLAEATDDKAEFKVKLSAKPNADVTITASSSDTSELTIDGVNTLVFNDTNWNIPQTVQVKSVDDYLADGTQSAKITLKSTSEDPHFNLLEAQTESYTILDNETVGLVLTPSALLLKPDANNIHVEIALTSQPFTDVTVTLATTNDTTAALSQNTFTFTPENWNTPQQAQVSCTDFMAASKAVTTETLMATATGDEGYNNLQSNEINLKIYAIQELELNRPDGHENVCNMDSITLLPGTYKLEAWGAQGGSDGPGGGKPTQAGGKGGYAAGTITLNEKTTIYYMIGEYSPSFNTHGVYDSCNGGGASSGTGTGAGGGGATHFASTSRGVLSNYADHREDIYLVAGGGGGAADYAAGGAGGGETGGNGMGTKFGAGATQTSGYKFGVGEPASGQNPGGGSGWYGGKRSTGGTQAGGGGGSGYIGGVQNGIMESGVQAGNGKVKVTLIEESNEK